MAYQRKSHILNDQIYPVELRKNAFKRPLWLAGFIAYLGANIIGSIFSIGYLPIVILAPIGAMGLVFNAVAARIVLGDPFTKQSIIVTHYLEYLYNRIERDPTCHSAGSALGQWLLRGNNKKYIGISFGILGGNVSSQSMLFAKSGLELIILTVVYHENQLQHSLTWILLVMLVLTAILQLYYLNKGLRLCDTVILIPLSFCAFNVSCLFNGLVYYDQWERLRWWQLLLVILGVTITVCGVLILSWRPGFGVDDAEDTTIAVLAENECFTALQQEEDELDRENLDGSSQESRNDVTVVLEPTEKSRLLDKRRNRYTEADD
ncbi:hypothetical protein EC973_006914 [Apophysomyces ossiformis]|uniref:Uncharacterized protein n=1 Tax=Apophysomyces ossiformis TaxID=679940 RepID=A0A8H7BUL9_9FUNG|nr:hypothetical protein EC973_006914 [Apophysomyces ossiformis]